MRLVLSVLFALVLGVSVASPAVAASEPPAKVTCAEGVKPSECDVDRDRIADVLEVQVCGSATCATGREDKDKDGISDWVEFRACETATCADASADVDADGIPDFAERLTCGSLSCSSGREDADEDKIADWIEFVICGDRICANGSEDYDADGIPDAKQLAACVVAFDVVTIPRWYEETWTVTIGSGDGLTGRQSGEPVGITLGNTGLRLDFAWWATWASLSLTLLGAVLLGAALLAQRRRDEARADEVETDEVVIAEILGLER